MKIEGEPEVDHGEVDPPRSDPEPRQVVGAIWCPKCAMNGKSVASQVKKNIKGKLYIVCPICSIDNCTSKEAQQFILEHMRDDPAKLKPLPKQAPDEPTPPAPKPKKDWF